MVGDINSDENTILCGSLADSGALGVPCKPLAASADTCFLSVSCQFVRFVDIA